MAYETYIVVVGQRSGRRYAERRPLNVPLDLATGNYEDLSDMAVRDFINDLTAEVARRTEVRATTEVVAAKCDGYDPFESQHLGGS